MSGGTLRRGAIAELSGTGLPRAMASALGDVVRALDGRFLQFVYDAGADARLDERALYRRGVAITLKSAAIQLADDLSDGDSTLEAPERDGPVLLLALENAFLGQVARAKLSARALAKASELFAAVGAGQFVELRTRRWTAARALDTALRLNGAQHGAYLTLLWDGTPLARRAENIGRDVGILVHLVTDHATRDPRFWTLAPAARRRALDEARGAAMRLRASRISAVARLGRLGVGAESSWSAK